MTEKERIRKHFLAVRRALSPEAVAANSRRIVERVQALPEFAAASAVLTYVASKDNEVETKELICSLLAETRPVLVPIARRGGALAWSRLLALDEIGPGRFGVLEPRRPHIRVQEPPQDAIALVPGIAFCTVGYRIGYGGGYFDRFLGHFTGVAVGLAYECQIAPAWAAETHDVPVEVLVTEERVLRPRPGGRAALGITTSPERLP